MALVRVELEPQPHSKKCDEYRERRGPDPLVDAAARVRFDAYLTAVLEARKLPDRLRDGVAVIIDEIAVDPQKGCDPIGTDAPRGEAGDDDHPGGSRYDSCQR
jgi:hypothetical protein